MNSVNGTQTRGLLTIDVFQDGLGQAGTLMLLFRAHRLVSKESIPEKGKHAARA